MREMDWSRTALGTPDGWPRSLHVVVQLLLSSRDAMWLGWGEDLTLLYNDAYRTLVMGQKHPWALGQRVQDVWPEAWPQLSPRIHEVLNTGVATLDEQRLRFSERDGHLEETYHTFSYSRIADEDGTVGGSLCLVTDDTDRVLADRRLKLLRDSSELLSNATTMAGLSGALESCLASDPPDVPFTLAYMFDRGSDQVRLVSRTGVPADHPAGDVTTFDALSARWPGISADLEGPLVVSPLPHPGCWLENRWGKPAAEAIVFPMRSAGLDAVDGVFICGVNPFRRSDEPAQRDFLNMFARQVAAGFARHAGSLASTFQNRGDGGLPAPRVPPRSGPARKTDPWTILVIDAQRDRRERLQRVLSPRWTVQTAADLGTALQSLDAPAAIRPDLIVADESGLGRDGVPAIRAHDGVGATPVLTLRSRPPAGSDDTGDESGIGIDDYLLTPFSSRDLLAHVEVHFLRAKSGGAERERVDHLAGLVAAAPIGLAMLRGPHHVLEEANASFIDLFGAAGIVGKPIRQALPVLQASNAFQVCDEVYRNGRSRVERAVPLTLARAGQRSERIFADWIYQPMRSPSGAVEGIAVFVQDATPLATARQGADLARRAKEEFLARIGHEFRNPLAPILTALELMTLRGITGGQRERAIITRQVKHLVSLVDDLLDVSRIARGHFRLARASVEMADVVAQGIELASPLLDQHRHNLFVSVPASGLAVDGDRTRLAQVISQLLTNAAKYTDPGGRISIEGRADGGEVVVSVGDTGLGIAAEMLPRVFDLFSQEQQPIDRAAGGLGLGLAIVKSVVAMHDGSVEAASAGAGRGSEFTIRLPAARAPAVLDPGAPSDRRPGPQIEVKGLLILVVDDNVDAAQMLAESLNAHGYRTRLAHDGPSALQVAEQLRPDAAILDLGLPVMDGFELARRFRAEPALRQTILIALTGYGQEEDRERALAAGFSEHLIKPVNLDRLRAVLAALTRH